MTHKIPDADILIHAGDFTRKGTLQEIEEFNRFLASLKNVKHAIVIAGNHDKIFDKKFQKNPNENQKEKKLLKNCYYLEDNGVKLFGLNIYGSPWQPIHCRNAFQLERGQQLLEKWNMIPNETDILVTHGPPLGIFQLESSMLSLFNYKTNLMSGYGDKAHGSEHVGCYDLLRTVVKRVKPKYHIFGHVHEGEN